jgi:hypothetical protein
MMFPNPVQDTLGPAGMMAPIRPALIRPDVTDDKNWIKGFQWGLVGTPAVDDYVTSCSAKRGSMSLPFVPAAYMGGPLWVNADFVHDGDLKTAKDLTDPKWKGKMISKGFTSRGFATKNRNRTQPMQMACRSCLSH